jgi:hypothetical protein
MTDKEIEKINHIAWEILVSEIQSLGEVVLNPKVYNQGMILNKLGYADNTALWIDRLIQYNVPIDPLLLGGRDVLNFLYNSINVGKYDDESLLINSTSLWRIVRYTSPAAKISIFPKDAIVILKEFLRKEWHD